MPDLAPGADWSALMADADCVIHCAARAHVLKETAADPLEQFRAANVVVTEELARAAAEAGVRRFIFLSSIGVMGGETHGSGFCADGMPQPHSPYAVAKLEAEACLQRVAAETGLELVIIRPPLVMGAGAPGNIGMLARAVRRGLPLPFGSITSNRRDVVSLHTLASLVGLCISHPAAAGGVFHVCDGKPLSTRAMIERIAALEGKPARLIPVPAVLLRALLSLAGRKAMASQLLGDLEVDIAHTASVLGWHPPVVQ